MKNKKVITAQEIRIKLHKLQYELGKNTGSNKLVSKYGMKVSYMLMWMRLIRINKKELQGWSMPDMNTIRDFSKKDKESK